MKIRIRVRKAPTNPQSSVVVRPTRLVVKSRPLRVLDFDVECRPLHFYGDYVSKEITAIAAAWTDQPDDVSCVLLGEVEPVEMLQWFRRLYDQADMVTGHFILGFDLLLLQGALTEYQLPALGEKLVQDTKVHLIKRHGMSGSQENLGATLRLEHPKVQMNQAKWRAANRLTPEGLADVRERVTGDVRQHIEMRQRLLELGYLGPAKKWRPGTAKAEAYQP